MVVDTKKVQGRRKVRYESLDEFFDEAQQLSQMNVKRLGNWSEGQIFKHLADSLHMSIDGSDFKFSPPLRWMMSLLMKKKFLTQEIPAGFSSGATMVPAETSTAEGLAQLQSAVARQKAETSRAIHPGFGRISREEWNDFHLRHAELHMSFLIPQQSTES